MGETLIAQNATVSYGRSVLPILRDIQMEVRPGALLGVIGPNGSGKSTLVRALSRVLRPVHGAALLDGRDLYAQVTARQSAQAIGVVPQSASAALEFTVRDLVAMGRGPHLPPNPFSSLTAEDNAIVDTALRDAGVADMSARAVPSLSGGEWQRVLLARALAQQPDILLLDEPTAHLDIRHQTQTLALARTLAHAHGKAVLAVLHDLNLAAEYCDLLLLIHQGRVAAQGTPADVLTEARIAEVYEERVWVRRHPLTRRPQVLTVPRLKPPPQGAAAKTVHLLCGAGTGAGLMALLQNHHYSVTCGVLSATDMDAEAADWLGIACAREAPFTPPSAATLARAAQLAQAADILVLMDVPIGPDNLSHITTALEARHRGVPVYCLQPPGMEFATRDFTQGVALHAWDELLQSGMICVPDSMALLDRLGQLYGNSE